MSFSFKRPSALHFDALGGGDAAKKSPSGSPNGSPSNAKHQTKERKPLGFFGRRRDTSTSGTTGTGGGSFSTTDSAAMFFQTGTDDDEFEFQMVNGKAEAAQPRVSAINAADVKPQQPRASTITSSLMPRKSDIAMTKATSPKGAGPTTNSSGSSSQANAPPQPVKKDFIAKQSNQSRHKVPGLLKKINDDLADDFEWPAEANQKPAMEENKPFWEAGNDQDDDDVPPPPSPPDRIASSDIPPPPPFPDMLLVEDD